MAKSLLLNVLVDVLGNYVEGLTHENLKLGVWSGKIEFYNLKLKDSALDQLNLPIQVKKGSLKSLRVKVPWTQLESKPVEIFIDGVYLLASPLDLSQCTPEESKRMIFAAKQKKLKDIDDAILLAVNQGAGNDLEASAQKASYIQQLTTCILDNLEVTLNNIHIRYEDSYSDKGRTFSAGITLDQLILTSSDETWTARFVKRDAAKKAATAVHKLGTITNCAIYWNPDAVSHVNMTNDEWEKVMGNLIFRSRDPNSASIVRHEENLNYILSPPNELIVKITHKESCNENSPNVDVQIESTLMPFFVDKEQFRQLMVMIKSFGDLDRKRQMAQYRPAKRATKDPRGWWHYAYRLVTGKDLSFQSKMKSLIDCARSKEKYIGYIKLNKINQALAQANKSTYKPLHEEEIKHIEETLPLVALMAFRQETMKMVALELQKINKDPKQYVLMQKATTAGKGGLPPLNVPEEKQVAPKKEEKKGFFSGWFSSSSSTASTSPTAPILSPKSALKGIAASEEEEDIVLMGDLESKMNQLSEASSAAINQMFSFRLKLSSSAYLKLTYDKQPIAELTMNLDVGVETRYSNVYLKFYLNNFSVEDKCTRNPYSHRLISMNNEIEGLRLANAKQRAQFELSFEILKGKSILRIYALPLLVTWNDTCVQKVIAFIVGGTVVEDYSNGNQMLKSSMDRFAAEAALPKSQLEMIMEIHAPKIIIPENGGKDERCTIVDMGFLSLNGLLNSDGMNWDIRLQNINVAMPQRRAEINNGRVIAEELYLVKPFDLNLVVQNMNKSEAELTVAGTIHPFIQAELNAVKIVRLIQGILMVVSSVTAGTTSSSPTVKDETGNTFMPAIHQGKPTDDTNVYPVVSTKAKPLNKDGINVKVSFNLPKVSLVLDITDNHYAELSFSGINIFVLQRIFDLQIIFNLHTLKLIDSQRPARFDAVILAQPEGDQQLSDLFSLKLAMISSKGSPLYRGNSMEIEIATSVINIFLDAYTTVGYKILIHDLLTAYESMLSSSALIGDVAASSKAANTTTEVAPKTVNKKLNPLGGVLFQLSLERVSLIILDATRRGPVDAIDNSMELSSLDLAFSFNINKLGFLFVIDDLFKGSASLVSIDLIDSRKSSESYVYKKLLGSDIFTSNAEELERTSLSTNTPLLLFELNQETPSKISASLEVRNVTVMIALDILMDFIAILMNNVDSIMEIVKEFSSDARAQELIQAQQLTEVNDQNKATELVKQTQKKSRDHVTQEFFFNLVVIDPRLILVEKPDDANSKAVINKCLLSFKYIRTSKDWLQESDDIIHVSLSNSEIFVVNDVSASDAAHRIVEPMGLEFHMDIATVASKVLSMNFSVCTTDIGIRTSLNDIVLATNIVNRINARKVIAPTNVMTEASLVALPMEEDANKSQTVVKPDNSMLTMYNVKSSISAVRVILVNDMNGQNNPLIRIDATNADFFASGAILELQGEGSITLKGDYYNTSLNSWEPLMELWQPMLKVRKDFNGVAIDLLYNSHLQLNVTGTLCKCITNAVTLVSRIGEEGVYSNRQSIHPLRISNQLGVNVELSDGIREHTLMELQDSELRPVPFMSASSTYDSEGSSFEKNKSRIFTLSFKGDLADKFLPLRQLSSVATRKPKIYHVQPVSKEAMDSQSSGKAIAPVTEDMFQYSRYNIMTQRWEAPWGQVGDPSEFANALGHGKLHPSRVNLPDSWQWVENDWKVDMSGSVGKDIDKDGWEYASNFSFFTLNNKKRCKQPTDMVRRRRLIRTRVYCPANVSVQDNLTAVNVIWEVIAKADESKEIYLRTNKAITNELPVDLEIGVGSQAVALAGGLIDSIVVGSGARACIPIRSIHEYVMSIRPRGLGFAWSDEIPLILDQSKGTNVSEFKTVYCMSRNNIPIKIGVLIEFADGLYSFTCSSMVQVFNRLPCALSFEFRNLEEKIDTTSLSPGNSTKLLNCKADTQVELKINLGILSAADTIKIPARNEFIDTLLVLYDSRRSKNATCTLRLAMTSQDVLMITVFSKVLVVDRSNLQMSLSTAIDRRDSFLEAKTYCTDRELSELGLRITNLSDYWMYGMHGVGMFQPVQDKLTILANRGSASIKELGIMSLGSNKTNMDMYDANQDCTYHFTAQVSSYPAAPDLSQVITFMPTYYVVNCVDAEIVLLQTNVLSAEMGLAIPAKQSYPFHGRGKNTDTVVFLKTAHSDWSLGCININDIGTSVIVLPRRNCGGPDGKNPVILNVDVRLSAPADPCYITVTIWESKIIRIAHNGKLIRSGAINFSIRNDSQHCLVVRQAGVDTGKYLRRFGRNASDSEVAKFELVVPPRSWLAYGWVDPDAGNSIEAFLADPNTFDKQGNPVVINTIKIGEHTTINAPGSKLKLQVKSYTDGKILHVFDPSGQYMDESEKQAIDPELIADLRSNDFSLRLNLESIGISLIADRPNRREFCSANLTGIHAYVNQVFASQHENATTLVNFKLRSMQIDNYSETTVYPVVLISDINRVTRSKSGREVMEGPSDPNLALSEDGAAFLEFSLIREVPKDQAMAIMKYIAFRMLEARISIDSATILLYMSDLHKDLLEGASQIDCMEAVTVVAATDRFNRTTHRLLADPAIQDTNKQYDAAQGNKIVVESLIIHPMKATVNFSPSHYPRSMKEIPPMLRWMRQIENVTAVEDFELKIKSFIANNAMESVDTLITRIVNKIARDFQMNILNITGNLVGSLSVLGKPAGLYKNIGNGVEDFFYEPYTGLMNSPVDFVAGLGRGTGKLITGVTTGVVGSAATVVGTATGGVASVARGVVAMSGDEKFLKRREEKRRELKASNGGVLAGFKAGGESIVSGFSSGISGLVTKPFEEGKKGGALGFFKGVGQGIVGVAVKPVMGVTEGISTVAQGINQQFSDNLSYEQKRPPRAFFRPDLNHTDVILVSLDYFSAFAQDLVKKRSFNKNYNDTFLFAASLGLVNGQNSGDQPYGLVMSMKYVYLLTQSNKILWSIAVSTISHVVLASNGQQYYLQMVEYNSSKGDSPSTCFFGSRASAVAAYDSFVRFRTLFGNSALMEPSDIALNQLSPGSSTHSSHSSHSSNSVATSHGVSAASKEMSYPEYKFGSANNKRHNNERLSDKEFKLIADRYFSKLQVPIPIPIDVKKDYHQYLDELVWRAVSDWTYNHDFILNPSRCCVCLLVNHSRSPVQINNVDLNEGAEYLIFGMGDSYDRAGRLLKSNGGAAVVFAFGRRPSLVSKEHVKFTIQSNAFNSLVSTRENSSNCNTMPGFSAVFLEKTRTDWWAKFVIGIN